MNPKPDYIDKKKLLPMPVEEIETDVVYWLDRQRPYGIDGKGRLKYQAIIKPAYSSNDNRLNIDRLQVSRPINWFSEQVLTSELETIYRLAISLFNAFANNDRQNWNEVCDFIEHMLPDIDSRNFRLNYMINLIYINLMQGYLKPEDLFESVDSLNLVVGFSDKDSLGDAWSSGQEG